jgi:putative transposase
VGRQYRRRILFLRRSKFALSTVRLRTKVAREAALAMTFKLIESAQQRRRSVNAPHLVALVRAGARFERGVLIERDEVTAA